MSLRLAGVGAQVGLTEADIAALGGALSSVGIEAEAGGTAFSMVMKKINTAVKDGDKKLDGFAKAAGVSSQEFANAWNSDPIAAIDMFVKGLGKSGDAGENLAEILGYLGIKGIREQDALLRLAGASDVLTESIGIANKGWDENTALTDEAAERYKTLESKLAIFGNVIKDIGITIGDALLPYVTAFVDKMTELGTWIGELNPKFLQLGALVAAVSAGFMIVGGSLLLLIGFVPQLITGFMALSTVAGALGTAFTVLTGPIGIAIAAIVAIGAALVVAYNKVDWFRAGVDKAWSMIKQATATAFNAIKSTITTIIASAVKFGSDQLDKFKAFWDANGAAIMSIVKGHFNNVKTIITAVMGAIKAIFTTIWPILSNTVLVTWNLIKTTVSVAISAVLGTIQTVMKLLQGDWKGAWTTIKKTASEIWSSIESFFKNVSLVEIGKDIIRGLANGIGAMGNVVRDAAISIAKNIKDAITGFFGIKSPSRVMMGVGGFLGEGLAIGMKSELANVKRMAKTLARAASIDADASFAVAGYQAPSRSSIRTARVGATFNGEGKSGITVKQTLHFHDHALSPAEAARKQKQAAQQLALQWQTR